MNALQSERLAALLRGPEEALDLAEAALLLATDEYPGLDVGGYLARLDALARGARERLAEDADLEETIVGLNRYLFAEQGFAGNTRDYYDPRNSYLNEVLDRRLGIPITLSILYIEIGRRLGLALEGVSFPGHFLVKFSTREGDVVLDPFNGGVPLAEEDLMDRLEETYGEAAAGRAALPPLLRSASKREILVRLLRNLKGIYLRTENYAKALIVTDRILLIEPARTEEWRDRARLNERLECFRAAADDYTRYLALEPHARDAQEITTRLTELKQFVSRLN
jgi:regulator of sirC expression with transglutaminase-like and TPR domain